MTGMGNHSRLGNRLFLATVGPFLPIPLPLAVRAGRGAYGVEVDKILAGQAHAPVVYFARIGQHVKIGTSTNLKARMLSFYLGLGDVLAVVPGDKNWEDFYHERFAGSRLDSDGRRELFRLDMRLRVFLGRWRCRWTETAGSLGVGAMTAVTSGWFALGVLVAVGMVLAYAAQPGQQWLTGEE